MRHLTINRRLAAHMIGLVCCALTAGLTAPEATAQDKRFDGVTLRVGTWGGSWRDRIHELVGAELEKRGAKVEYVIGNPRDNLAKLVAARGQEPPIDVLELTSSVKQDTVDGQFLQPLDFDNIPNAAQLSTKQRDNMSVATWISEECIVYNTAKFQELGLPAPDRYSDLLNPKLAGRVSFPDINVGMAVNGIIGFAADAGGDETNIDPGLDLIKDLDVESFYSSSVELSTKFKAGDVWAAVWHAGWALRTRRAGVPVTTAFPKVKNSVGMIQYGWIGVVKGSKNAEAAEFFINRYLDTDVQRTLAEKNGVAPVNRTAAAALQDDALLNELMLLKPEEIANTYVADWSKISMSDWSSKWNRVIAR